MLRTPLRFLLMAFLCLTLTTVWACAAKGVRNQTRVGALTVGEAALAINQTEQRLAAASVPGYDVAAQKAVSAGVLQVLLAARAYERAAKAYPESGSPSDQVAQAKVGIIHALDDLAAAVPAVTAVREPLLRAIDALRVLLTPSADAGSLPVVRAQALPPQVTALFALANLFVGLLSSGRSSVAKLKELLQREGATDEELDALDVRLSDAIAERQADQSDPQ
jgi:hypothetical protein